MTVPALQIDVVPDSAAVQVHPVAALPERSLGERLRKSRLAAGLTQEAVAREVPASARRVSSWERDRSAPPDVLPLVSRWARTTDVSVVWLLLGRSRHMTTLPPPYT